jgi:putative hydrolase of the HAD superfamily
MTTRPGRPAATDVVIECSMMRTVKDMRLKGIFFDLYGTLLVYGNMKQAWSDWLSTFYGLLKKQGLNLSKATLAQECNGFFSSAEPATNENNLTALERRIEALCLHLNHNLGKNELRPIADRIAAAWQAHIFIDPQTVPVLSALKQNKTVGLVSNFDHPPHVRRVLSDYGLKNCFDSVIISGEVGVKKPDPAIFAFVLEQTGLAPADVVYVGDTQEDVAGAIAAGIRPILLVRPHHRTNCEALDYQSRYPDDALFENGPHHHEITVIASLQEILNIANRQILPKSH